MIVQTIQVDGQRLNPSPPAVLGCGPLWVRVRPGLRRGAAIASDTLVSLGKNLALHGHGRNENEDIALAAAWIKARNVQHLIMWDAHELSTRTLPTAISLAEAAATRLSLVYGVPISDSLLRRLAVYPSANFHSLPQVTPRQGPSHATVERWDLGPPVQEPFHTFRAEVSGAHVLHLVPFEKQISITTAALKHASSPAVALHSVLADAIMQGSDDALLSARLKGIQVAAWAQEIYVSIDFPQLMNSPNRPRTSPSEADHLLLAYRQPLRAICVALALRGVGIGALTALTIDDVDRDGNLLPDIGVGDTTPALQSALCAQWHLRISQGASPKSPLVPLTQRTLTTYIHQANVDLGIQACGPQIPRARNPSQWLKSLGINIERLT